MNASQNPDQSERRPDHWTVWENFETHSLGVFKPGQYRAKHLAHEPGVYEMTDLVLAAERDRLRAENEALKAALTRAHEQIGKYDLKGPKQVGRALMTIEGVLPHLAPVSDETEVSS